MSRLVNKNYKGKTFLISQKVKKKKIEFATRSVLVM